MGLRFLRPCACTLFLFLFFEKEKKTELSFDRRVTFIHVPRAGCAAKYLPSPRESPPRQPLWPRQRMSCRWIPYPQGSALRVPSCRSRLPCPVKNENKKQKASTKMHRTSTSYIKNTRASKTERVCGWEKTREDLDDIEPVAYVFTRDESGIPIAFIRDVSSPGTRHTSSRSHRLLSRAWPLL